MLAHAENITKFLLNSNQDDFSCKKSTGLLKKENDMFGDISVHSVIHVSEGNHLVESHMKIDLPLRPS